MHVACGSMRPTRMPIENGMDAEKRNSSSFSPLPERFRNEQYPEAADRLGEQRALTNADI